MRLFAVTIFLGAFLLFQVQPLIGKYILPRFGSAPGVWTTCLLFFQLLLLGGYAYAHLLAAKLAPRVQAIVHGLLLLAALALLPITPSDVTASGPADDPTWPILVLLAASIGVPYLILSATGPLLQSWFARARPGSSPYRLYALSNVGSILALVTYPFVVEPALGLSTQTVVWSVAFAAFAVCCAWSAWVVWRAAAPDAGALPVTTPESAAADAPRPPLLDIVLWLALAACGSGLLMATTNRLCTDIVVIPFLWVLPLGLYLLTFVICFDHDRWYSRPIFCALLPLALGAAALHLHRGIYATMTAQIAVGAGTFFLCLMCCHGELARLRPHVRHLTLFYLMIALGGAVGGLFVAIVAPLIFDGIWEYPLLLFACYALTTFAAVRAAPPPRSLLASLGWSGFVLGVIVMTVLYFDTASWLGAFVTGADAAALTTLIRTSWVATGVIVAGAAVVFWFRRGSGWFQRVLPATCLLGAVPLAGILGWYVVGERDNLVELRRNFYGTVKIVETRDGDTRYRELRHGRIMHGLQNYDLPAWPASYYSPYSGIGIAVRRHPARHAPDRSFRIGVVGLGAGTLATYCNALILAGPTPLASPRREVPGDSIAFYEINPIVEEWAWEYFTFLADAESRGATVVTHLGDARLVMEEQLRRGEKQAFDLLVIDAFNSDAVPIHLLTNECFATYTAHLAPGGILAVNVTNLHLDLAPVVHRLARENGYRSEFIVEGPDPRLAVFSSGWVLVTRNEAFLATDDIARRRRPPPTFGPLWTDDFSSIAPLLR